MTQQKMIIDICNFFDPAINYDKSIDQTEDPIVMAFNDTIEYLQTDCHAYIGMHGYTHQYGNSRSADGYEFNHFGPWAAEEKMQPLIFKQEDFGRPCIVARHPTSAHGDFDIAYNVIFNRT
ncbi:DUF2334 domain-containing protein [Dehalobacter sp. DCM]|uniref:DUF2334 domain-containing protein n=1 Tax=Dehalobacter sp. DCM TaxID=2907827 RepID=UPI003081E664|nr:DUF2334 domain-containing protein [Dehalobacter sp. DCM]